MDENTAIINNFEALLKKQTSKKPLGLYSSSETQNKPKPGQIQYSPKDIIVNVYQQMKAIQKADVGSCKRIAIHDAYKKREFLTVDMIPINKEVNQNKHSKFETQCISDTQLINIIENAEIIDKNRGVTQEFYTTFCLKNDENNSDDDKEVLGDEKIVKDKNENLYKKDDVSEKVSGSLTVNVDDTCQMDTLTCLQNDVITNDEISPKDEAQSRQNEKIDDHKCDNETDRSTSPILNAKRTPPPLVFSLYAFEKFENLAHPIIEEHADLQTAKNLINSQIIGNELFIPNHIYNYCNRQSPVLSSIDNISIDADQNTTGKNIITPFEEKVTNSPEIFDFVEDQNNKPMKVVIKTELKDEILFSSDEEEEYLHKDVQELPLTCALETSFYEKSDVLDKTMYVGFQTASNKSIRISTESFCKAKSVFNDTVKDGPSLQDLVEIFDTSREKGEKLHTNLDEGVEEDDFLKKQNVTTAESDNNKRIANMNEACIKIEDEIGDTFKNESLTALERDGESNNDIMMSQVIQFKSIATPKVNKSLSDIFEESIVHTKRKLEGFKTASNKKIKLSDKALARCKKVFQDINLKDNFEDVEGDLDSKKVRMEDEIVKSNVNQHVFDIDEDSCVKVSNKEKTKSKIEGADVLHINDQDFLHEFEDNDMPFERTDNNFAPSGNSIAKTKNTFKVITTSKQSKDSNNVVNIDETIFKKPDIIEKASTKLNEMCQDFELRVPKNNSDFERPSTSTLIGFKTAANKEIKISTQALEKMKNFYKDIDKFSETNLNKKKPECIEENRSTDILQTGDVFAEEMTLNEEFFKNSMIESENQKIPVFKGFQTANNKPISISEKALENSRKLFEDISNNDNLNNEETKAEIQHEQKRNYDEIKIAMFPTSMVTDKKSIEASTDYSNSDVGNETWITDKQTETPVFKGFQTASNKNVIISNEALAKSIKLFEDINLSQTNTGTAIENSKIILEKNINLLHKFDKNNEHTKLFVGFKTASSKPVEISADVLAKSKKMFNDFELEDFKNDEGIDNRNKSNPKTLANKFTGFHTANNKEVEISEDALAKCKRLFNDFELNNDNNNDKPEIVGFKTASNKEVKITDEALAKSKNIFKDINEPEKNIDTNELKDKTTPMFKGFQTASNKHVNISEKALEMSKKLFQDIKLDENVDDKNTGINKDKNFRGFQTASNKKVDISDKALAMSKKLFEGIEMSQLENDMPVADDFDNITDNNAEKSNKDCAQKAFTGFQTASNKKVVISEQALAKTKTIFNEEIGESKVFNNPTAELQEISKVPNTTKAKKLLTELNLDKTNAFDKEMIDTQVLNDFQDNLNTEDFCQNTPKSKRSGSPILSCPRAKKRRFETPYRNNKKIQPVNVFMPPKLANTYKFKDNYKKDKKYTLNDLQKLENDTIVHIDPDITKFNFDNLLNFEFSGARNDHSEGKVDVNQLKKLFLDAVNKKIVPDGWLDNHIKLIIWKLLSYEVKFPGAMKNVCTVSNVMDQLKYRYDKELYNVQRPVLRKILEKDNVASKTMVLCVAGIYVDDISVASITTPSNNIELLVTDGWYCVRASIDRMLGQLVCHQAIVVGGKLAISGAELVNCEQGIAPWEDTSSVRLKLSGNSTRRARWSARLGARAGRVACGLRGARADGGRCCARACVVRRYPPLYVERAADGGSVTLSERLEHIRQMKFESEQQIIMEKLYEELEKQLADQESQDSESYGTSGLDSGSQIAKEIKRSRDPDEYRSHLTASQHVLLEQHSLQKREKQLEDIRVRMQAKLEKIGLKTERNVVQLLKVRLVEFKERDSGVEVCKGYLSIWKPSPAVMEIVTEGAWIEILNAIPTGVRNSEIQLSAGRQTVFNPYKQKNEKFNLYTNTLKRRCYEIKELTQNPSMSTDYNEIDTVGMIFQIEPSTKEFDEKKQNFQNVFLADADKNIICVNFWGGLKKFGFENILDTGQIVTCVNLQKRAGNTRKSIPQYRVTEFTYFTKTPKDKRASELSDELSDKLSKIKDKFREDCVLLKNNYSIFKTRYVENVSPYQFGTYNMPKRLESPLNCETNLNLTGLDFESSFNMQMSPEQLMRKKRVIEKIAKLKMYGEPPPLSSIHIVNQSKNASATYKSPLIPKTKVASDEKTPNDYTSIEKENLQNVTSPKCLNRTFVKKVNPVKLNFSNSVAMENDFNDSVDNYADDFEASPPLSLDSDAV